MSKLDYFPLSTAAGTAFCNRKQELAHFSSNIQHTRPTLVVSPRRYGKTSLALRAFALNKVHYAHIDFYKEISEEDIERSVINGVGQLLGKMESRPKQLLKLAGEIFGDMRVKVAYDKLSLSLELSERKQRPADNIQMALEQLEALAKRKKIKAILFIDEFQKLAEICQDYSIEAAIRHVAQLQGNITYVFSGSRRHLIEDMFFNSDRAFYRLCDVIRLDRIGAEHYFPYLQKAAKKQWDQQLGKGVIESILEVTQCHPYYVNLLCSKLWRGDLPNEDTVYAGWNLCARENVSQIEREIDLLSFNQRKLLILLAKTGGVEKPTSAEFLRRTNMSATSLKQALDVLLNRDYVHQNQQGVYCVLDPLFAYVLS